MANTKWLTFEDAVYYLGIGKTRLYQLAKESKIPASKMGNKWRFDKDKLDKWVEQGLELEDYFMKAQFNIEDNESLRTPQRDGYITVYDHFKNNGAKAIVQMPVGCGKSGLAAILPLGISSGRVLVVTPNLTIRDEMRNTLDITHRKCFWKVARVLPPDEMVNGPFVTTLEEGNVSVCKESHFVVTNVQQLSVNPDKWLNKFSDDFFDMIIVDEAHHSPAKSWQTVFNKFPNAKVIFLTATPFRADRQELEGELVYRYSFKSASSKGYIKRLKATYVSPSELTFTMEGKTKTYSLNDIMELKEEVWFSRGVALSEVTNISIVDNSISKLEQLREDTGTQHQLIAVAMSINHAEKIASLYQERQYNAKVIHSKLPSQERDAIIAELRNGTLDCIIQVQILGEGFDHQKLSVAAVFRPFRTLSPYIQFVGRVMRVIVQNSPGHPDNYGHIVTHLGLNLDELIQEFKKFDNDDEEFWARVLGGEEPPPPNEVLAGSRRLKMGEEMVVDSEIIENLFEEDMVEDYQDRVEQLKLHMEELGLDSSNAVLLVKGEKETQRIVPAEQPLPVQPQLAWKHKRQRLDIDVRSKAKVLLNNCDLELTGKEIPYQYNIGIQAQNNLIGAIKMFNREVNKLIGKESRNNWTSDDFDKAIKAIPDIGKKLVRQIKAIQNDQG